MQHPQLSPLGSPLFKDPLPTSSIIRSNTKPVPDSSWLDSHNPRNQGTAIFPTSTITTLATNSPALLQTSTGIPPLPSAFDSPQATGKVHTPAAAIVSLVAIIIFALFLFVAFCYFIFLRFRGKCPQCPQYQGELEKWKNGSLKPITREMVYNRQDNRDLERSVDVSQGKAINPPDHQAKQNKATQRAHKLARLEQKLRALNQQREPDSKRKAVLLLLRMARNRSQREGGVFNTVDSFFGSHNRPDPSQEAIFQFMFDWAMIHGLDQLPRPTARDEAILADDPASGEPNFKGTYEEYERDVLAAHQRQKAAPSIAAWYDVANDPNASEAKKARALAMASSKLAEMDDEAQMKRSAALPREPEQSRSTAV